MGTPTLNLPTQETLNGLEAALAPPSKNSLSTPVVTQTVAKTEFADDGRVPGAQSNVPGALASGNAANSVTAIQNSNKTVSHACDSSTYVGMAAFQAGAFAGQIIASLRAAKKAIIAAFGVNPSSSSLSSKISKLALWISDQAKFIAKIANALQQFISYVNAIKQFINFILSLPEVLLAYFKDCINTLKGQLIAGFASAIGTTDPTDKEVSDLTKSINQVKGSISEFNTAVKSATTAALGAVVSTKTLATINSGDAKAQQAATQEIFAAAGFPDQSKNYGGKA